MSVFVHAQGIKTVHAGRGGKWQNSVHIVVNVPLGESHDHISFSLIRTFQDNKLGYKKELNNVHIF